jgi:hypothetical protein
LQNVLRSRFIKKTYMKSFYIALTLSLYTFNTMSLEITLTANTDPSFFPTSLCETALASSSFGPDAKILSIQGEAIAGLHARRMFPSAYAFQLVHVTRVKASVTNKSYEEVRCGNDITMVLETASAPAQTELPIVAIALAIGWFLTAASCSGCWLLYYCCAARQKKTPPPIMPRLEPAQSASRSGSYAKSETPARPDAARSESRSAHPKRIPP